MKAKVILVVLVLAVAGLVGPAGAQTDAEQPSKVEQLRQQFLEERADVLAKVFEKRAELVRLSAQKDPDLEKVQGLVKEISELQSGLWKKCAEHRATVAALGQPARAGALRRGLGLRGRYNVGRGQCLLGSRREWGRRGSAAVGVGARGRRPRGRGQRFGPGRREGPPQAGMRGRGAPGRGQGFGPGRGWAPPQAGERGRPLGGGFGLPNRPMMGGRGMGPWGTAPLSDDVGDEPAPSPK